MAAGPAAAPVAEPAAVVTLDDDVEEVPATLLLLELLLVTAAAADAGADAEAKDDGDETGVEDADRLSVVPDTLSGAFGWPPSSGDGAILESVKRREIISGRRRQTQAGQGPPRPCTGSSSSLLENLLLCGFFNCSPSLCLPLYIRYILYLHTLHTLLLHNFYVLFYCYFLPLLLLLLLSECFSLLYFSISEVSSS